MFYPIILVLAILGTVLIMSGKQHKNTARIRWGILCICPAALVLIGVVMIYAQLFVSGDLMKP